MKRSWWYGVAWSFWLGYWLGNLGCDATHLKFWYIFVPIVILADLEAKERKKDN